jgi:sugar phosphate isomerase/epimerase
MKPRFSVSEFTTFHLTLEEEVELLTGLGVTGIDIAERKLSLDRGLANEQMNFVAEAGLTVTGFVPRIHAPLPDSLNPDAHDLHLREQSILSSMSFVLQMWPDDPPPVLTITGAAMNQDYKSAAAHVIACYRRLATRAAALGVCLAFEPLSPIFMNTDTIICTWANALRLADAVDNPSFRLAFDTWHVWDEHGIYDQLRASLDRIETVHVSDWISAGPRGFGDRAVPGDGLVDWVELVSVLNDGRYTGPIVLEIFSSDELPGSLWKLPAADVITRSRTFVESAFGGLR